MKVFAKAQPHLSRGIHRVADALERYAPDWVELVSSPEEADLRIGHVIGIEGIPEWCDRGPYALIQYCLKTGGGSADQWEQIWQNSRAVWSYYDLDEWLTKENDYPHKIGPRFYYAPLGV